MKQKLLCIALSLFLMMPSCAIAATGNNTQWSHQMAYGIMLLTRDKTTVLYTQWEVPDTGTTTNEDEGFEIDYSARNHTLKFYSYGVESRVEKGLSWVLEHTFNDHAFVVDEDDLSFTDGVQDKPFTLSASIDVIEHQVHGAIIGKWDEFGKEYMMTIGGDERFFLYLRDETTGEIQFKRSVNPLPLGWTNLTATYDGRGGNRAADGIKLFANGIELETNPTVQSNYNSMTNTNSDLWFAAVGNFEGLPDKQLQSDLGFVLVVERELSPLEVWCLFLSQKGYYEEE